MSLARIHPVHRLQLDRQVFIHPQARRNGPDQVRPRSGNDQNAVPTLAVLGNAAAGVAVDDGLDHVLDPRLNQMLDLLQGTPGDRLQAEGHVVLHLQVALAVGLHQLTVAAQEVLAVDPAQPGHLLAPQRRTVPMDQGFVQIENCQCHCVESP